MVEAALLYHARQLVRHQMDPLRCTGPVAPGVECDVVADRAGAGPDRLRGLRRPAAGADPDLPEVVAEAGDEAGRRLAAVQLAS